MSWQSGETAEELTLGSRVVSAVHDCSDWETKGHSVLLTDGSCSECQHRAWKILTANDLLHEDSRFDILNDWESLKMKRLEL